MSFNQCENLLLYEAVQQLKVQYEKFYGKQVKFELGQTDVHFMTTQKGRLTICDQEQYRLGRVVPDRRFKSVPYLDRLNGKSLGDVVKELSGE